MHSKLIQKSGFVDALLRDFGWRDPLGRDELGRT